MVLSALCVILYNLVANDEPVLLGELLRNSAKGEDRL